MLKLKPTVLKITEEDIRAVIREDRSRGTSPGSLPSESAQDGEPTLVSPL